MWQIMRQMLRLKHQNYSAKTPLRRKKPRAGPAALLLTERWVKEKERGRLGRKRRMHPPGK